MYDSKPETKAHAHRVLELMHQMIAELQQRSTEHEGLAHHYAHNRHHPEHFPDGINGMTLMDLVEMLADWKAATERHDDGSLARSLGIQQDRFGITHQLAQILTNTAEHLGWLG